MIYLMNQILDWCKPGMCNLFHKLAECQMSKCVLGHIKCLKPALDRFCYKESNFLLSRNRVATFFVTHICTYRLVTINAKLKEQMKMKKIKSVHCY